MTSASLNYAQGFDPSRSFYSEFKKLPPNEDILRADDPHFQDILRGLQEDPNARAFVLSTFSLTHAPYHHLMLDQLCDAHPAECAGLDRAEMLHYLRIYWGTFLKLQFNWEATIAAIGLTPEQGERLAAVLRLAYITNVAHLDRRFGELVDAIAAAGLLDQSLIVFTADHGELIDRRISDMRWSHGFVLSADDLVVPLLIRGPGVPARRIDAVTRSIDVFPTIAGLAGLPLAAGAVQGTDLSAAVRGEAPMPPLLAFSHSSLLPDGMTKDKHTAILKRFPRRDPALMWVAVRDGDLVYKLTSDSGTGNDFALHVYDWAADPGERNDLYDPVNPTHAAMLKRLGAYKGELTEAWSYWQAVAGGRVPSERQRELMRSLGYID
jgi:arylsulfatase A-like enzyme